MTNEQLNTALYEKMAAEQAAYRDWLLKQKPEDILDHTYEYSMRENIVMEMEELNLPSKMARKLLDLPDPVAVVYHDFDKIGTDEMDVIRSCIEDRAKKEVEKGQNRRPSIREQLKTDAEGVSSPSPAKQKGQVR